YLAPHLSQRIAIDFPRRKGKSLDLESFDVLLLNPKDPGWGSSRKHQQKLLSKAKQAGWWCESWDNGLELCQRSEHKSIKQP
ncbi:MAG: DUF2079 domain-containing protein, partial [Cyanobacteriota bacterium]|nr:DUF2079 domain-containing protein [Cyanobacteriota bacterium]